MKDKTKNQDKNVNCRLGTVGGEAVLEGIMMKGPEDYAIAVRRSDGSVSLTRDKFVSIRKKCKFLRIPIIRGIAGFIESMIFSYRSLTISAEQYGLETDEPESKFDKWLTEHLGEKLFGIIMTVAMVFGVALALGMFFFLPPQIVIWIERLTCVRFGIWKAAIEGVIKIAIFVGYILLVSLMKDIRRTFEYHGAEHKSIFCYESGEELNIENVKKQKRFHPRCGTSFIFVILIISILVNSLPFVTWDSMILRVITKILMLPLIVGIGFEFIMFAGKHDNVITRILSAPGLFMQRITTKEPDDEQIEVAIIALKSALPNAFPNFVHVDTHEDKTKAENASEMTNGTEEAVCDTEDGGCEIKACTAEADGNAVSDESAQTEKVLLDTSEKAEG